MPLVPLATLPSTTTTARSSISTNNEHPHPLRSHCSAEDLMASRRPPQQTLSPTLSILRRGDSGQLSNDASVSRSARSSRSRASSFQVSPPSPAQTVSFTTAQGLGDGSRAGASIGEVPPLTKPTPSLRPKVSFSTVSQVSFFSANEPILDAQGKEQKGFYSNVVIEQEEERRFDWRFWACFAVLGLVNFGCDFSATALSSALPTVSIDLNLTAVQTFWVPGSMLLSAAVAQPFFTRLGMTLGCKSTLLGVLPLFIVGSILAARSQDFSLLICGRCIEGIGAGASSVLTQLALTQTGQSSDKHPAERNQILKRAALRIFWLGFAVGPVVGGAFAQSVGWRHIFWVQMSLALIGLCSLPFLLRLNWFDFGTSPMRLFRIDVLGWILLSGSIASICIAITSAGTYAWASKHVLLPLLVGVACLPLWCFYNRYRLEAIVPVTLFRHPSAAAACFGSFAQGIILASIIYLMPLFFQVQGLGEIVSGLLLAPWTFSIVAFGLLAGLICQLLGGYRWAIWAGWSLMTLGVGLMIVFKHTSTAAVCAPIGLAGGIALGTVLPLQSAAIEATATADEDVALAGPTSIWLTTLGMCFGVLAGGCIFLNRLQLDISLAHDVKFTISLLAEPLPQEGPNTTLAAVYTTALRPVWIATCALAGLALFLNFWFLEDHTPPRRPSFHELE